MEARKVPRSKFSPERLKGLIEFSGQVGKNGLDRRLHNLLDMRVSQINGCAYCCHSHAKMCRDVGIPQTDLDVLAAWREASSFSAKERAALAWAEAMTLISVRGIPDDVQHELTQHFSDDEIVDITLCVVSMNAWNRLAISTGMRPPTAPAK